ncbi:MAG: hypothetical protein ACREM2_02160 [Vulcanimicrobiaceae bacterium]
MNEGQDGAPPLPVEISSAVAASSELLEYVRNPPRGTAVAAALSFGIDVHGLLIKVATTTPLRRLQALDRRLDEIGKLRAGMR